MVTAANAANAACSGCIRGGPSAPPTRVIWSPVNGGGPLFSAESVKAMWTPRFRTGEKTAVGLGWMLEEVTGHQTWTWTGDIGTSGSVFLVLPDQNLGVAVLANYDAPRPLNQLAEDIVTIALGGEPPARPSPSTHLTFRRSSRIGDHGTATWGCTPGPEMPSA